MTSVPLVASLRARPEVIRLADAGKPAIAIRVQLAEAWDAVCVEADVAESVASVKASVLNVLAPGVGLPDDYMVKLGGIEIIDEGATLANAGVVNGSTLFIAYRRRRPVR